MAVIDLEKNAVAATWPTAEHPTEMALTPDGKALYVACANSTKVSVLDPATGKALQTVTCSLYPNAPPGNTPNSLALTPDGKVLFVANADANNLAVFNVEDRLNAKPLGFIPTGWYPTSVRFNGFDKRLYVANGKGASSKSNRAGPNPLQPTAKDLNEYIGQLLKGTLAVLDMPTPADMARHTKTAYECSPLQRDDAVRSEGVEIDNPIPRRLGDPSPIKHVIYIVKENRTYDQVFGDMPQGNGERELCLFPEAVTPNHHKLAREFVLLDNTYVDGEVSADGHEWSMGAYASDFVEKVWPLGYRGSPRGTFGYPAEGAMNAIAPPGGGYLWDKAIEAKVSVRTYGEWVDPGKKRPDGTYEPNTPAAKALEGRFDPQYRPYDLDYPDVRRAERFIAELKRFEQAGEMPRLQIMRLPNDHTSGTRVGKPTPTAYVADNDLALGRVVDAVSHSAVLEGHRDLRDRGRRPERPGPRGRPSGGGAGGVAVHEAGVRRFVAVLDHEPAADDGADPGVEADEPVRRRRPADVPRLHGQAEPGGVHARDAAHGPEGGQPAGGRGGGAVRDVRPGEGGPRGRHPVQPRDLAVGEGRRQRDAGPRPGGVLRARRREEGRR